jgi:hypothetical protein
MMVMVMEVTKDGDKCSNLEKKKKKNIMGSR